MIQRILLALLVRNRPCSYDSFAGVCGFVNGFPVRANRWETDIFQALESENGRNHELFYADRSAAYIRLEIMRPSLLAVFLATVTVSTFSIAAPTSLIGHEVPPLPVGCESKESMLLGASDAFAYDRLICNGSEIVLLQRFKDRRGREAYWEVIDQLQLPTRTSKSYALTAPLCSSKNYPNEPILAIGRWSPPKDRSFFAKNISRAWRFNLAQGRIEAISPGNVSCEGENAD